MNIEQLIKQLEKVKENLGNKEVKISNYDLTHFYEIRNVFIKSTSTDDVVTLEFKF